MEGIIFISIFIAPLIIGNKVLKKYGWIHVLLTEILLWILGYFNGPFGPIKPILPTNPYQYYYAMYFNWILANIKVGYLLITIAFIWSLIWIRKRWYESRVLLYYELVVFVEFIILMPTLTRLIAEDSIAFALSMLSR